MKNSQTSTPTVRPEHELKNAKSTLALILAVSLLASAILHHRFSGAYVRSTPADTYTYWIGPVSTTIPFAFWALVTLLVASMRRDRPGRLLATTCGYATGWIAMTTFSLWVVSLPRGPEYSSSMAIAVVLTPFLFVPIFPILFLPGYIVAKFLFKRDMSHEQSNKTIQQS